MTYEHFLRRRLRLMALGSALAAVALVWFREEIPWPMWAFIGFVVACGISALFTVENGKLEWIWTDQIRREAARRKRLH